MAGSRSLVQGAPGFVAELIDGVNAGSADALRSLRGIDVRQVLDRATCFVRENSALYRWVEDSVLAPNGTTVVLPLGQAIATPGRWVLDSYSPASPPCSVPIRSLGDFPAPVGGVITLDSETCYVVCGFIDLEGNVLALSDGTTLIGTCGPDTDGLLRIAGATPMLTLATPDASVHVSDLQLSNATGPTFDFSGDAGNVVDVWRCVLDGNLSLGTILTIAVLNFTENRVSGNSGGLGVSSIAIANFVETLIVSNLGPFTFLTAGAGVSLAYRIENCTHLGPAAQTFLDLDVVLAVGGRGIVSNNVVQGGATPLVGTVTPASLGWFFTGNVPYGIFNSRALAETSSSVGPRRPPRSRARRRHSCSPRRLSASPRPWRATVSLSTRALTPCRHASSDAPVSPEAARRRGSPWA